jgi:DNA adenine methylase
MIGPIPYIGGKNRLATKIIKLFPDHTTYVEAFCGGAQVFFHKQPSEVEVLNDLDHEVVNFLRVCQWHHEELIRYMKYMVVSRRWFEIVAKTDSVMLTDVQRAGRFLYLQKNAFGGLVVNQRFHYGVTQPSNFNPERVPKIIEQTHHRLQHVQLECLSYDRVLTKYDRLTTLFYLDPPYWGPKLYKTNFTELDFHLLAERLQVLQGKFILSLNDRPEVREVFAGFHVQNVELSYTAQRRTSRQFREVLITNFFAFR